MKPNSLRPATITRRGSTELVFSGDWTARGLGEIERQLAAVQVPASPGATADAAEIGALDTAGGWVLRKFLERLRREGVTVGLVGLPQEFAKLLEV